MINDTNIKLSSSTYLLSCDLINKYSLLSIYKEPKVSKIVLSISLKEMQKVSYASSSEDSVSSILQAKTFLFFYLLFGSSPYVLFQSIDIANSIRSKEEGDFTLKATIRSPNRISSFLSNLCTENKLFIKTSEFELFNLAFQSKTQTYRAKGSFNIKIPADFFFDVNLFFLHQVQDLNLSKAKVTVNFVYENFPANKRIKDVIRNSFLFD